VAAVATWASERTGNNVLRPLITQILDAKGETVLIREECPGRSPEGLRDLLRRRLRLCGPVNRHISFSFGPSSVVVED
jgi:hypothetical protein